MSAGKLWDKGEPLDAVVERFTVGRDPELDRRLAPYDALASAAHARMLAKVDLLDSSEADALVVELRAIAEEARAGGFEIRTADEDCHTAIERRLTERLGDAGRRIHTGRSRNDQVIAALRLFAREAVVDVASATVDVATTLCDLAERHRAVSVPGYTHTRQAMPSTMGLLFGAHAESLVDDLPWLEVALAHADRSALGSASGYGVPLPLDRQMVADLLGMGGVQANTLAVQNDRGKTEHLVLTASMAPAQDIARLAADLVWFSSEELGYVRLGAAVTTGSSIMPQKRNPDPLELVRATAARLRSRATEAANISGPLPSGYHRDLQLTKEPFLEGMQAAVDVLAVMVPVLDALEIDPERCRAAMTRAIGATDAMCRRVAAGEPLRTAYRSVGADPAAAVEGDPAELWRGRTHLGAPGALDLAPTRERLEEGRGWVDAQRARFRDAWQRVLGDRS